MLALVTGALAGAFVQLASAPQGHLKAAPQALHPPLVNPGLVRFLAEAVVGTHHRGGQQQQATPHLAGFAAPGRDLAEMPHQMRPA